MATKIVQRNMTHQRSSTTRPLERTLVTLGIWASCIAHSVAAEELGGAEDSSVQRLPETIVQSGALEQTLFESAQPVTVLSGQELMTRAQTTLGETLSTHPGISSSTFGPGASRPIIRGLGGDRIRILENGIGTQDVSNTSPDHTVTIEPSLVNKIEVVRGPAALLYGTSAVGGVINVFDNRIPEELPDGPVSGTIQARGGTADKERTGVISLNAPAGPFAFHFDAFARQTDDIDIPGFARTEALRESKSELEFSEPKGRLPYSATESDNITAGTSYIRDNGFIGAALSNFTTKYGVPNGEENISIDAERQRVDIRGKLFEPFHYVKDMDLKIGIVEYDHTEFQGPEPGTKFKNDGVDARYEIRHAKIGALEGVLGFQYQHSDFAALGEEAYQPPTESRTASVFLFEEYSYSEPVKFQVGARFDHQSIDAEAYTPPESTTASNASETFPTFSQSAGLVWSFLDDYALAFSLAHTERAPTGQELFANGPHIATAAFEVGDPRLDAERSWGYDVTLRKKSGPVTGSVGIFYNRFSNYIGLIPTGATEDELQVFEYSSLPADFYGFETQIAYHLFGDGDAPENLSIDLQPDYVYAENRQAGEPIPRIPPFRVKAGINYSIADFLSTRLEAQHVFRQERNAPGETETPQYTLLNAYVTKPLSFQNYDLELFIRGTNLLNEKAREHTSFIKDIAPLPGANVLGGVQLKF